MLSSSMIPQWLAAMLGAGGGGQTARALLPRTAPGLTPMPGPTAMPMLMGGGTGTLQPASRPSGRQLFYTPGRPTGPGAYGGDPVIPPTAAEQATSQGIGQLKKAFPALTAGYSDQDLGILFNARQANQFNTMLGLGGPEPMTAAQQANYDLSYDAAQAAAENAQNALAYNYAQLAQQQAYQQAQMAQQAELARLAREEQRRQMAAQIGQAITQMQSQQWSQALPTVLPRGTQYAPGMEPGGAASGLYSIAGLQYQPQRIVPSPAPSRKEMEQWIKAAISRFS